MSSEGVEATDNNCTYMLVPATIIDNGKKGSKWNDGNKQMHIPYGALVVDGGYIINGVFYPDVTSEKGRKMVTDAIAPKLLFVFSEKYLSFDSFIRPYIDVDGYFPISLLLFIPAFQSNGVTLELLAQELNETVYAEVDMTRMLVRPRENWEKWLVPNMNGGMGLPRYVIPEQANVEQSVV